MISEIFENMVPTEENNAYLNEHWGGKRDKKVSVLHQPSQKREILHTRERELTRQWKKQKSPSSKISL